MLFRLFFKLIRYIFDDMLIMRLQFKKIIFIIFAFFMPDITAGRYYGGWSAVRLWEYAIGLQ